MKKAITLNSLDLYVSEVPCFQSRVSCIVNGIYSPFRNRMEGGNKQGWFRKIAYIQFLPCGNFILFVFLYKMSEWCGNWF